MEKQTTITEETVDYVANLARLEITPEERSLFTHQMGDILAYVDKLQALDTSGVEATFQVLPAVNVMREDAVKPSLSVEAVLSNAPERAEIEGRHFFKMPKILESEE